MVPKLSDCILKQPRWGVRSWLPSSVPCVPSSLVLGDGQAGVNSGIHRARLRHTGSELRDGEGRNLHFHLDTGSSWKRKAWDFCQIV